MGVENLKTSVLELAAKAKLPPHPAPAKSKHAEALLLCPCFKGTAVAANNQLLMTPVAQFAGKQQQLPLPSAQFVSGVNMSDFQHILAETYWGNAARRSAGGSMNSWVM
jgi:hypothetical protein